MGCENQILTHQMIARVSIHAPVWGANEIVDKVGMINLVSIHAPVWGAKLSPLKDVQDSVFQSTHPCGVRKNQELEHFDFDCVSIHAPVWGAKN